MKKLFLLVVLVSYFGFSQVKNPITLPDLNTITIDTVFKVKPLNFNKKAVISFTSYNPNLNIQIDYLKTKRTYSISSLNQNTTTLGRNKTDTFNPSGVSNIGSALVIGVLNLIFQ